MELFTEPQGKQPSRLADGQHLLGPLSIAVPTTGGGIYPAANGVPVPVGSSSGSPWSEPTGSRRVSREQNETEVWPASGMRVGGAQVQFGLPNAHQREQVRASGEIVLLQRVMIRWGFDDREAACLIGYEDPSWMRSLYGGLSSLRTRDEKDRLRAVLRIATDLLSLYRDEAEIGAWLREKKRQLGGESAYDLMMEGSMENLLRVKQFIEVLSGR